MSSKKNYYSFIILLNLSQSAQAVLSLCSKNEMRVDSVLNAQDSIELNCGGLLTGCGTIQAPKVVITTQTFEFKGTIDCNGECVIMSKHSFDHDTFVRKGSGKFVFKVDPDLVFNDAESSHESPKFEFAKNEPLRSFHQVESPHIPKFEIVQYPNPWKSEQENELINFGKKKLLWANVLELSREEIHTCIDNLRTKAKQSDLNMHSIFMILKEEATKYVSLYESKVKDARDFQTLRESALFGALAILTAGGLYYYFKFHNPYWKYNAEYYSLKYEFYKEGITIDYSYDFFFNSTTITAFPIFPQSFDADKCKLYADKFNRFVQLYNLSNTHNIRGDATHSTIMFGTISIYSCIKALQLAIKGLYPKFKEYHEKYQFILVALENASKTASS